MKNLTELANELGLDKGTQNFEGHSYTIVYDELFKQYIDTPIRLFEIGINDPRFTNSSVHLWEKYFNNLFLVGFDITDCKKYDNEVIHTYMGDQSNVSDLEKAVETFGGDFDIIIDDGSHVHEHHIITYKTLFPHLKIGGLYIIEDLHAYNSPLTIDWFKSNNISFDLYCNNKLMVVKK